MNGFMLTKHMTITYKDGHQCEHRPVVKDEDDWWRLVMDVTREMAKPDGGVLLVSHPYGMHQVSEITYVHFGDDEGPVDQPALGFQRDESAGFGAA